jgi:hypothetical protein
MTDTFSFLKTELPGCGRDPSYKTMQLRKCTMSSDRFRWIHRQIVMSSVTAATPKLKDFVRKLVSFQRDWITFHTITTMWKKIRYDILLNVRLRLYFLRVFIITLVVVVVEMVLGADVNSFWRLLQIYGVAWHISALWRKGKSMDQKCSYILFQF